MYHNGHKVDYVGVRINDEGEDVLVIYKYSGHNFNNEGALSNFDFRDKDEEELQNGKSGGIYV